MTFHLTSWRSPASLYPSELYRVKDQNCLKLTFGGAQLLVCVWQLLLYDVVHIIYLP